MPITRKGQYNPLGSVFLLFFYLTSADGLRLKRFHQCSRVARRGPSDQLPQRKELEFFVSYVWKVNHLQLLFQSALAQSIVGALCPKNTTFTSPRSVKLPVQSLPRFNQSSPPAKRCRIFYDSVKVAATCAHFDIDFSALRGSYGLVPMRRLRRHVEEAQSPSAHLPMLCVAFHLCRVRATNTGPKRPSVPEKASCLRFDASRGTNRRCKTRELSDGHEIAVKTRQARG